MAAARSISRYGCRTSARRLASRQRSPRAAGWCATSSRLPGGRSPTRRATRPTSPPRRAATERPTGLRSSGGAMLVPVQHPHRAESVPAAGLALTFIHLEVDRTRVRILQGPASVFGSLALDEIDRLGPPVVRFDARTLHVLEPAQNVVEVAGREGEAEP